MDQYIITYKPNIYEAKADVRTVPYSSKVDWDNKWWKRYFSHAKDDSHIDTYRVYDDPITTPNEIEVPYYWGLSGPDGAYFVIFFPPGSTSQDERYVKQSLRGSRDVVDIQIIRAKTWLDLTTMPLAGFPADRIDEIRYKFDHKYLPDGSMAVLLFNSELEIIGTVIAPTSGDFVALPGEPRNVLNVNRSK